VLGDVGSPVGGGPVGLIAQFHLLRERTLAQGDELVFLGGELTRRAGGCRLGARWWREGVCLMNCLVHGYSFLAAPGVSRYASVLGYSWPGQGGIYRPRQIGNVRSTYGVQCSLDFLLNTKQNPVNYFLFN
jgi:hypothetical protein